MFPLLFTHLDVNNFHCETCELVKHHHVSFPLSNIKSSTPIELIHIDVWGPLEFQIFQGHGSLCPLLMIVLE